MVPADSPVQRLADMKGRVVCFMSAGVGQRVLEAALARQRIDVARLVFQEASEMLDAYNVGRCDAVADEATALAALSQDAGVRDLRSRLLSDPLALSRVIATTPTSDGRWTALAFRVLGAMQSFDAPASPWTAELTLPAASLGIRASWRDDLRTKLGSYGALYRRDLGDGSVLHLAVGPNAPWPEGLLLPPTAH